jgi:DNA-binding SARP family transcriptional activator
MRAIPHPGVLLLPTLWPAVWLLALGTSAPLRPIVGILPCAPAARLPPLVPRAAPPALAVLLSQALPPAASPSGPLQHAAVGLCAVVAAIALGSGLAGAAARRSGRGSGPSPVTYIEHLLAAITRGIADADPPRLAQVALAEICRHLDADRAFIALRDEIGTLQVQAASERSSLRSGDVIHLPAVPPLSLSVKCRRALGCRAIALLVPLGAPGGEQGLLGLGPRAARPFADAEVATLVSVAGHLGLAIENARLRRLLAECTSASGVGVRLLSRDLTAKPQPGSATKVGDKAACPEVAVDCLGELTVTVNGERLPEGKWGGRSSGHRHAKAVFALLLANRERTVGRDELIEVIWGDSAELDALANRLDRTVSALRRALEPGLRWGSRSTFILSEMGGYRLNPSVAWRVDSEEFTRLLGEGSRLIRAGAEVQALDRYLQAIALYRGEYMDHCPFVERSHVVSIQREMLRQEYVEALLRTAELYGRLGSPEEQLRYLHKAVQEDEFNERAYQVLVAALCEHSRHAEARRLCREHRAKLAAADVTCSQACFRGLGGF